MSYIKQKMGSLFNDWRDAEHVVSPDVCFMAWGDFKYHQHKQTMPEAI